MSKVSPSGRDGTFAIADAIQVSRHFFLPIAASYALTRAHLRTNAIPHHGKIARLNSLNLLENLLTVTNLDSFLALFNSHSHSTQPPAYSASFYLPLPTSNNTDIFLILPLEALNLVRKISLLSSLERVFQDENCLRDRTVSYETFVIFAAKAARKTKRRETDVV